MITGGGVNKELVKGIEIAFGDELSDIEIGIEKGNALSISKHGNNWNVTYIDETELFRALSIIKANSDKENFELTEKRAFDTCGLMLDVSRNAVPKVETMKKLIVYMAKMGLNTFYIYAEDIIKLEKYKYFGYMRGAYSKEEISDIVEFAECFGIEVIPCVQTLGHLEKVLRWPVFSDIADTDRTIMPESEKTYEFIEEIIKTCRECFKTNKIHIGMDEAPDVGFGNYFKKYGFKDKFELLSTHLKRVSEICKKYELKPMMWGDMVFHFGVKSGTGYLDMNTVMRDDVPKLIPENVSLVYWDYYSNKEEKYDTMIDCFKKVERNIIFGGGIWTWVGFSPNYYKAFTVTKAGLASCRKNNIKDVFATMWGDDGAECSFFSTLPCMQLYAESNYYEDVTDEQLSKMFKICTGIDRATFDVYDIDNFGELCKEHNATVSKQVLYSDVLNGLLDYQQRKLDLKTHYKEIIDKFEKITIPNEFSDMFAVQKQLLTILYKKSNLGNRIIDAYKDDKKEVLKAITSELSELYDDCIIFDELVGKLWYKNNKPFSFEFVEIKLGGMAARVKRARIRLEDYLTGNVERLPELEVERLSYNNEDTPFVDVFDFGSIATI